MWTLQPLERYMDKVRIGTPLQSVCSSDRANVQLQRQRDGLPRDPRVARWLLSGRNCNCESQVGCEKVARPAQASATLHDSFFDALKRICGKEIDQSKAIAKIHRLATHNFQEVPHFPKVVQVNIASAILNDLEESRLELLRVLQRLCSRREEDRCKTPGLWLKALEAARDEKRKLEFKAGFLSSLQKCASVGKDVEQASKDVTCVPCCAVAGCLAILSAILELELTSKAFACDMMPEDLKDNV